MSRSRVDEFGDTIVVLVASAVLLAGFAPLLEGYRWAMTVLAVLVPVAAVTAIVRLRAPAWGTPVAILTGVLMLVWVFVPGTTVSGLPTPRSFAALADLLGKTRSVILEEVAPIAPPDSIVLLIAATFLVTFVLADAVARQTWRVPLLGLLWVTMLVVPSVISMQMPAWPVFLGAAAAWLWLWWSESPHAGHLPTRAAGLTGAAALLVALALPVLGPDIEPTSSDFGATETEIFGAGINPMIELGQNLRQSKPRRVLTYTSDASEGQYLRVATLRQFTGRTWGPSPVLADADIEGVDDLDEDIETQDISTRVRIDSLRSNLLPVPYPATRVRGLEGQWQWLRDGSTVRAEGRTTTQDQRYTVSSLERRPTADQVRAAGSAGSGLNVYRNLPRGVPETVTRLARTRSADARTDYDRMVALQDWLREDFSYSVESPVEDGYDGNGLEVMEEFLRQKSGYCVHFASTLAVMGRIVGVPTRVAVGYAPGDNVLGRTSEGTTYGVDSDDLHAWTEAYFSGIGWIGFDATPGVGEATAFAEEVQPQDVPGSEAQVPESNGGSEQSLDPGDDGTTAQVEKAETASWRPALVAAVVLAVLGALPAVVRQLRRRRRWTAGQSASEPLWSEIADTARDLGIEPDPTETPRGFARRLGTYGVDVTAMDRVVNAVEQDRYAGTVTTKSHVGEAQQVVGSLQASRGRRTRWLARIAPRSLLR